MSLIKLFGNLLNEIIAKRIQNSFFSIKKFLLQESTGETFLGTYALKVFKVNKPEKKISPVIFLENKYWHAGHMLAKSTLALRSSGKQNY